MDPITAAILATAPALASDLVTSAVPDAGRKLSELLDSSGYEWTRALDDSAFVVNLECDPYRPRKARIEIVSGAVVARTELARIRGSDPDSTRALEHFLLALNSRLRFARGSLLADEAVLEVVFPASSSSDDVIGKTLGALSVGADWAHRECGALCIPTVAKRYLGFNQGKGHQGKGHQTKGRKSI